MFAKTIIDSDAFLDMPVAARLLYYDLGMRADDDGFVNNPKLLTRMVGATSKDMDALIEKGFIIPFDSGVIAIRHWRVNNRIRKDLYKPTVCTEEAETLDTDDKGTYFLRNETVTKPLRERNESVTKTLRDRNETVTSVKESKVENSLNIYSAGTRVWQDFAGDDKELLTALLNFDEMRKQIKKPMTDKAREILIDKLTKAPEADRVQMLNNSIEHCWQTVYPLDRQKPKSRTPSASYDKDSFIKNGVSLIYRGNK